jgi:hypothetical protein
MPATNERRDNTRFPAANAKKKGGGENLVGS